MYVTGIKEKQIFKRIRWQTWALFECVFYKFAVPVVGCLTVAAGILARSKWVIEGTGADQRFVKNAFKNAECHPFFLINISSYLLSDSYNGTLFKSPHSVYVKVYWLIIFVFVNKRWKGLNKHRFIEMFWSIINIYLLLQKLKTNNV